MSAAAGPAVPSPRGTCCRKLRRRELQPRTPRAHAMSSLRGHVMPSQSESLASRYCWPRSGPTRSGEQQRHSVFSWLHRPEMFTELFAQLTMDAIHSLPYGVALGAVDVHKTIVGTCTRRGSSKLPSLRLPHRRTDCREAIERRRRDSDSDGSGIRRNTG
jgi:hypothetical protein